jgi:hypothetical protein
VISRFSVRTLLIVMKFQAGSFDPWGGPGFEACAALVNHEFERVFYKNDLSFGAAILNLYMVWKVLLKIDQRLTRLDLWRHELGQPRPSRWIHVLRLRIAADRISQCHSREVQRAQVDRQFRESLPIIPSGYTWQFDYLRICRHR